MAYTLVFDSTLNPGEATPDLDMVISSQSWIIQFPDYADLRVAKYGYFTYLRPIPLPVIGSKLVVYDSIAVWNSFQQWQSGSNSTGYEVRFRLSSSMAPGTAVKVWRGP